VVIRRLPFVQPEELGKGLLRLDFGRTSPYIPHLEMNSSRCGDVDEIEAIGRVASALYGPLTVEVEFGVFKDVV
jgi:hypothetical protein